MLLTMRERAVPPSPAHAHRLADSVALVYDPIPCENTTLFID